MVFRITQGDTSPVLSATLSDGTTAIDLTNASDIEFHMMDEYQNVVVNDNLTGDVRVVDADQGEVEYQFSAGQTDDIGTYYAEWQVTFNSGAVETFPTKDKTRIEVLGEIA